MKCLELELMGKSYKETDLRNKIGIKGRTVQGNSELVNVWCIGLETCQKCRNPNLMQATESDSKFKQHPQVIYTLVADREALLQMDGI